MKILFSFFFAVCFHFSYGAHYYFSSLAGDDSRSSEEAQTPLTPWKTLDKLNSLIPTLQPGDSVFLKRGETFPGTIHVNTSGSAGNAIYYGAYGTGTNPVISGWATVTDWTLYAPGIYSAPLDATNLNIISIDGQAKSMGRYPNTGYLNYESHVNNQSITDNELPASPNWTGAEVVIRKYRFILDRHVVTNHAGTTLNYSTSTDNGNNGAYSPVNGNGYFFQNSLQTLDQFGEWYYDAAAKRLYVYFGTGTPTSFNVKASVADFNVQVSTVHDLVFEQLDFEGANKNGLSLVNTYNVVVRNCNFRNQGGRAVYGIDLNNVLIDGGSVNTSFSNGIFFEYDANNCTINNVSVANTNTIAGTGRSGDAVGIGIMVYGNNTVISNNRVVSSGYNGIQFIGNSVLVEKNYIDSFCLVKDDGGGIYTYTGSATVVNVDRKIRNNIVLNAIGAFAGAEAYNYEPFGKAAGIYLDEYSNNLELTGNTVANGDWGGIVLHNVQASSFRGNTIYNHRFQVHVSQYAAATRNLTMTDNQYIAKQTSQKTFYYRTYVVDDPSTMGTFDYNYYARPLDDNATIQLDNNWSGGNGTTNITLAQWQSAYSLDQHSQKSPLTYSSNIDDNIRFEYNNSNTLKIINLPASYVDVKNNQYAGSIGLDPFTSVVLLKSPVNFLLNQVITFPPIGDRMYSTAPVSLNATSTSGLPITYRIVSGPATVNGNTLTIIGTGAITVEASQAGNASYKPANPVSQSFSVSQAKQSIDFPAISDQSYGSPPFAVNATASSGLPVSFSLVSGPATLSGNIVTLTGTGTVTIQAAQDGNTNYNAASPVQQSFAVVGKTAQTITFPPLSNKTYGNPPFTISAMASSGLTVVFRVAAGPATVSGNTVTLTGAGTVTIEASQPGNSTYDAAPVVNQSFVVAKASQTITFPSIANKTYGNPPFNLTATASSGLAVSYRVVSGPATVSGSTVTITGAGTVTMEASQLGDANYNAATPVQRSFTVAKAAQSITFPSIPNKVYGSQPFAINATASSGLPVSFSVVSGPAKLSGNIVTLTGTGKVTIQATQSGNTNYNAASPVQQSFNVTKATKGTTSLNGRIDNTVKEAPEATDALQLMVYPNPVYGEGSIRIMTMQTSAGSVSLYNSEGKLITNWRFPQLEKGLPVFIHFDSQPLAKGIYYLRFAAAKDVIVRAFTVL